MIFNAESKIRKLEMFFFCAGHRQTIHQKSPKVRRKSNCPFPRGLTTLISSSLAQKFLNQKRVSTSWLDYYLRF